MKTKFDAPGTVANHTLARKASHLNDGSTVIPGYGKGGYRARCEDVHANVLYREATLNLCVVQNPPHP